jgi:lipopolysaccharide export system protein LptA
MFNNFRHQMILNTLVAAILFLSMTSLSAAPKAPVEPINIDADNAKILEKEGKSIYTGNVVLVQGATKVTADKITVLSKNGKLSQIVAEGSPVTYQQANQPKAPDIKAEATLVEYYALEKRIVLLNNAKLTQGKNSFSGNRIEYNAISEVVTASQSKTGKERVRVTIQPDKKSGDSKLQLP